MGAPAPIIFLKIQSLPAAPGYESVAFAWRWWSCR